MKNQLLQLASKIDSALECQNNVQLNSFLSEIEKLKSQNKNSFELAQLDFFAANIYADLKKSATNSDFIEKWSCPDLADIRLRE